MEGLPLTLTRRTARIIWAGAAELVDSRPTGHIRCHFIRAGIHTQSSRFVHTAARMKSLTSVPPFPKGVV